VLNRIGRERLLEILQDPEFRFYDPNGQGGLWVGKAFAAEPAYRRDPLAGLSHGANALQVVRFYCALEEGTLVNERQSAMMLETLVRPEIEHKFVKALAPYRVDEIFRKSGTWRQYHADSALVRLAGHSYVMVALAQDPKGSAWLERLGAGLHELATSWQRFDTLRTANARGNAGPTALTGPPSATALLLSANEKD
jgi:beta-lactamase class A